VDTSALFSEVLPEDLVHFGLIPEFIGRLPIVTAVNRSLVEVAGWSMAPTGCSRRSGPASPSGSALVRSPVWSATRGWSMDA
jgi:hypothetical protein